jgi:hypothetical protein
LHALGWSHLETDIILPFKEIKIGDQIWADRNLDVSHFRNGDPIPEARTDARMARSRKKINSPHGAIMIMTLKMERFTASCIIGMR